MKFNYKILFLGAIFCTIWFGPATAQQLIKTELRKDVTNTSSKFVNTTYVNHGSIYKDRIELKQLNSGQSGYTEFSFDDFDNSDITIGLQNAADASQTWAFQFLNGEILINGTNYGPCASGSIYRVERCDASIKFYGDGVVISENSLSDINFEAIAIVEVNSTSQNAGNNPSLTLRFPFLNNCQATPPGTVNTKIYTGLKKHLDGTFLRLTSPVLRFKYVEDYAVVAGQNSQLDWVIYDWDQAPPATPNQSGSLTKRMGLNYFQINLSSITTNRYYTLEVKDSRGEKQYLRFLYYCPNGQDCIIFDGGGGEESLDGDGDGSGGTQTPKKSLNKLQTEE